MPIRITCKCGKVLQTKDEFAGKKVRCPACQGVLIVPMPPDEDPGFEEVVEEEAPRRRPPVPARRPARDDDEEDDYDDRPRSSRGGARHQLSEFSPALAVLLSIFVPFFSIIYFGLMHGKLPKAHPDDPGAGKAIGFMFIPIFNIYWFFVFHLTLADRVNRLARKVGLHGDVNRPTAALILCLIPCIAIVGWIMMLVFYASLQAKVNEIVEATA